MAKIMILQEFRKIVSAIAQTEGDDDVLINFDKDLLHFQWRVDEDNILVQSIKCEFQGEGEVEIYGMTSLGDLIEIEKSCEGYIGSTSCWVDTTPTHINIHIGDFRFVLGQITEEPKDGNRHKYFRAISEFDEKDFHILVSAASIAARGMGGVSINCFSNIMEITAMNSSVVMYKYITTHRKTPKPFSFNIDSKSISLLDSVHIEGTVIGFRGDAMQETVLLMYGDHYQMISIITKILPGRYTYPKTPINNLSDQRLLIDKPGLIEFLHNKFKEYYSPNQILSILPTREQILSNQICIVVDNGFATIKSHDGEIHCVIPVAKKTPSALVWVDGKQLFPILKNIEEDQVYLILPEKEHHPLVIESDQSQYALLPLIKRSHCPVNLDNRSFDEPLFREVLEKCPGLRGEGTMEVAVVDFPLQNHIFEQWEILDKKFKLKYNNLEAVEAFQEMLVEQVEDLCSSIEALSIACAKKGMVDTVQKEIAEKLRFYLEFYLDSELEGENSVSTLKQLRLLIRTGIAIRGYLLERHLGLEKTFRVETITCF